MKSDIEELRKQYIENSSEGMTSEDISLMSGDVILNMDYFLNEDDLLTMYLVKKVLISFNSTITLLSYPNTFLSNIRW